MKTSKPLFIIILGRPGSGKGTQADLLEKKFNLQHVSTGQILRRRAKKKDYVGKKLFEILESGNLVPTPLVFQLWMPILEAFYKKSTKKGILFDGSPRKLYEARMLDETLRFYSWKKSQITVLNIQISPKEAMKRLLKRGRHDDERADIQNRLGWYIEEVIPVLLHYKRQGLKFDVNGAQSVEDVHKEILRKLKLG